MKNLLLTAMLFIMCNSAMAWSSMRCTGTDTTGQSMYLLASASSSTVNINGDSLAIIGTTNNGQGLVTKNFISVYGVLVYDSIVPVSSNVLTIYQFNAVTQALLAQAWLTCQFYGITAATSVPGATASEPSVMDHQIFKSIKSIGMTPYNKK